MKPKPDTGVSGATVVRTLTRDWGIPLPNAERVVVTAAEHGLTVAPSGDMNRTVTVTLVSRPTALQRADGVKPKFRVQAGMPTINPDSAQRKSPQEGAKPTGMRYTSGVQERRSLAGRSRGRSDQKTTGRRTAMAPRGKAQAEPEVEETVSERDFTVYAEKELSPTMHDYVTWVVDNVFDGDEKAFEEAAPEQLLYIGITVYQHFQRSDFNKERKEARRAEKAEAAEAKAAAKAESEEEEAPAPRRGRGKAAAPAPKAPRGRPAKSAAGGTTTPRRGRPRKGATQPEEAAF